MPFLPSQSRQIGLTVELPDEFEQTTGPLVIDEQPGYRFVVAESPWPIYSHVEYAENFLWDAELICYAETWNSQCYCVQKGGHVAGFDCVIGTPIEVFDRLRQQGVPITPLYIVRGRYFLHEEKIQIGWSNRPWRWIRIR